MPPKKKGKGRGRGRGAVSEREETSEIGTSQRQPPEFETSGREQHVAERTQQQLSVSSFRRGRGRGSVLEKEERSEIGASQHQPREFGTSGRKQYVSEKTQQQLSTSVSISQGSETMFASSLPATKEEIPTKQQMLPSKTQLQEIEKKSIPDVPAEKKTKKELISKFKSLELVPKAKKKVEMSSRPGIGRDGRPIALIANYFLLGCKYKEIYHYDVDISFIKRYKKEEDAGKKMLSKGVKSAAKRGGTSLLEMERTKKEALEKKISLVEHQMNRSVGKQRCREVIATMVSSESFERYCPVYDGQKNVYTCLPLPFDTKKEFTITIEENDFLKEYLVTIKPVQKGSGRNVISSEVLRAVFQGRCDKISQETVMAFDTVMCHRNPPLTQVQVGRSFFFLDQTDKIALDRSLEIWFGYNQSIHLTQRGPAVVVNYSAKVFHKAGTVIEYANDILGKDITKGLTPRHDIKILSDSLSKVKVKTEYTYRRTYTVKKVTEESAQDICLAGTSTTVKQYFLSTYGISLKHPYLPCLHMQTSNNKVFIPMELCVVKNGQPKLGKLPGPLTAKMIRQTAILPAERFRKIMAEAQNISQISGQYMRDYSLFMDTRAMQLQGRVISAPSIGYRKMRSDDIISSVPDLKGTWKMEGKRFVSVRDKIDWVIISFSNCPDQVLDKFANLLCNAGHDAGLDLPKPVAIRRFDRRARTEDALKFAKQLNVIFAVVILSSRDALHSYEEVKFIADFHLRLVTQCMDDNVVIKKCNAQVASNVILKINSKIGGVNHKLIQRHQIFARPIIIMGADAAHSPRGSKCPSIAAVVGSLDPHTSRYAVTCRHQWNPDESKSSQEIIVELKNMVKYILNSFLRNTRGRYPERILFFRDGVSEGQFETVLEEEIPQIQEACQEELNVIPPLTFIVVQKRHQTRFRPQNPKDGVGRMGNIPPGTTVDTDVTHPVYFDFFLCSHEGIQGTSKPAHYTVLFDENKFTADTLQQICYHLCHTYNRCNRSISIPAPVMYAHLAAARAKKYADFHLRRDTPSVSSTESEPHLPDDVIRAIEHMEDFDTGMFYV